MRIQQVTYFLCYRLCYEQDSNIVTRREELEFILDVLGAGVFRNCEEVGLFGSVELPCAPRRKPVQVSSSPMIEINFL